MKKDTNSLRVTSIHDASTLECNVEFDPYIPFQMKSYSNPLGAGYLRLGDISKTLVELVVEPHTQILRGVTLTWFGELSPPPSITVESTTPGLPVLATDYETYRVDDVDIQFNVALDDSGLIVHWGELARCTACVFDRMLFLMNQGSLVGFRCSDLTANERELFRTAMGQG